MRCHYEEKHVYSSRHRTKQGLETQPCKNYLRTDILCGTKFRFLKSDISCHRAIGFTPASERSSFNTSLGTRQTPLCNDNEESESEEHSQCTTRQNQIIFAIWYMYVWRNTELRACCK